MGDIVARGMASAALESIQDLQDQITSIEVGPGVQNFKGWGYQDFSSITGTSVTITDNENGEVTFDASKIINNTACIVLASDGDKVPYTGAIKLFSTRVAVSGNTGASVTLNAIPHASYGALRIYYYYNYTAGIPDGYSIAPKSVGANLFVELDNNFATDEELTAGLQAKADASSLADVALSGSYDDLSDKPTIPTALSSLTDDTTHRLVTDTEKSTWNSKSDFDGDYDSLSNKPTLHDAVTVTDSNTLDITLTVQAISAEVIAVKDQNTSTGVTQAKIWTGTQAEYDAIGSKDAATLYFIKS